MRLLYKAALSALINSLIQNKAEDKQILLVPETTAKSLCLFMSMFVPYGVSARGLVSSPSTWDLFDGVSQSAGERERERERERKKSECKRESERERKRVRERESERARARERASESARERERERETERQRERENSFMLMQMLERRRKI